MLRVRPELFVAVVLLGVVLAGCGDESGGQPLPGVPYGSPAPSGHQNDPAVTGAADRLDPMLRRAFASSYAGLVLNHDGHTVVVYRKPDAALDARVRSEVTDVTVELEDAKMSLREMQDLMARVLADKTSWNRQGITISSVGPDPTGSGIEVMTLPGSSDDQKKLRKRYGTDAITVSKGSLMLPTAPIWSGFHTTPPTPS